MHESRAMGHRRSSGEVRPYVRSSKPRFNWTSELKLLFEEAMIVLGGTRKATPKQIRELMKCPDIQLSHIKSRLQMCRIRMEEKERKSGSNSSEEMLVSKRRERTLDNIDANGDEHSDVVDENEPTESAPPLSRSCSSLEYQSQRYSLQPSPQSDQRPFKRFRVEVQPTASSFQSNQYYFGYFGPRQEYSAVAPEFSAACIFRKEQSDEPKEQENNIKECLEEEDDLQLSLSLSTPTSANRINLELTL
ncbi:probable transcription factor KAN4 [Dendrobium catenatum]|uniref:probable transcription factor KAN4 n=1 Tax=Dendrobium catenatum TaxID=906689 RepID=UPI0009F42538|nr:probable transcription factor KAN4 [Dendrobium catenatum]